MLAGRVPLTESVVTSLADQIAVLPLLQGGQPAAEKLDTVHASVTAGVLRYHYDAVLVDLGALSVAAQAATAQRLTRQCRLDGIILVADAAANNGGGLALLDELAPELSELYLGDIVNFVEV